MATLTFDESAKKLVLQMLGKGVDEEGYIIELKSKKRVLSPDGNEVLLKDFAGVRRGSEIFITKDLPSLIKYANPTIKG